MVAVQPVGTVPATTLPLVRVENLKKHFPLGGSLLKGPTSFIHAVDNISFEILPGRSLALVGESGSGKTTTGKLLVRLIPPTGGHIYMSDEQNPGRMVDLARLRGRDLREFRRRVQMIFQDPYESLNPRLSIFDAVAEPLAVQGIGSLAEREERVAHMLEQVGLSPATSFMFRFPHELSGGQRQRVAIGRALIQDPELLLLDEPFGALDALTRERMGHELLRLWQLQQTTVLMVTHSISEALLLADRVLVLTPRPGRLCLDLPVAFPRPRSEAIVYTPEFGELVRKVKAALGL